MKFSIIIATLNNEETIERNIQSIINQNYNDYEIIIIDGTSKDKTIDLIKKFGLKNLKIKFQKAKGVYNAFNEEFISSDIIIILNADDYFGQIMFLKNISEFN